MQIDQGTGWPIGPQGSQGSMGLQGFVGLPGGPGGPPGTAGPPALWLPSDHGFYDWNNDPLYLNPLGFTTPATNAMNLHRIDAKYGGTVSALFFLIVAAGSGFTAPTTTNVTGTANSGSGAIRLTVMSSAAFSSNQIGVVAGVVGTTEANGSWVITVVDGTHVDLVGSTYVNGYVSGGTLAVSSNCVAIYSSTGAFLSASADMAGPWGSLNDGCLRHPLATPIATVAGSSYWVALVANASALPTFRQFGTQFGAASNSSAFRNSGASLTLGLNGSASLLVSSFTPATNTAAPYAAGNGGAVQGTSFFAATGP